jgi:hypothetical protein
MAPPPESIPRTLPIESISGWRILNLPYIAGLDAIVTILSIINERALQALLNVNLATFHFALLRSDDRFDSELFVTRTGPRVHVSALQNQHCHFTNPP